MLEAILAKDTTPKKGLTKEHLSSDGDTKEGSFKDLFSTLVKKTAVKEGEEKAEVKTQLPQEPKSANNSNNEKTINSLLDAIIQSAKKDPKEEVQKSLQGKLLQAKTILESTLNQKLDIKDLKDVKTLKELIIKANEKGLNVKSVKVEAAPVDEKQTLKTATQKTAEEPKKITQSFVASGFLEKAKKAKTDTEVKTTLASLLAKDTKKPQNSERQTEVKPLQTASVADDKKPTIDLKQLIQNSMQKDESGTKTAQVSAQNKDAIDKNLSVKQNINDDKSVQKTILDTKVDINKEIELKSLQNAFAQKELQKGLVNEKIINTQTVLKGAQSQKEVVEPTKTEGGETKELKSFLQATTSLNEKIGDAKATIKHFASSLKEQIQNYKPPVSKITLSLNPRSLGEVEVVIKSRGDSLTVQINSATAPAMQVLAQNAFELRQNLVNMGFENLSMQFSSNSQGQQGQGYNEQEQKNYYNDEEIDEETAAQIDELIINLPKYV